MKIIKILLLCLIFVNSYAMTNEQWRDTYLNDQEKEWIKDNPIITYSEINWKPISIIENDKMLGILGEYLNLVSKKAGIKTKFIPASSWPDVLDKFKKREIDLVPGASDLTKLGHLSKSFAGYPMVAVTADNSIPYIYNLESVKDKVFSVPKYWTSWKFIKEKIPNAKIIETDSLEEAILNVAQKKADIFIGHVAVSAYHISTIAPSLKITGELDFEFNHHFMVHENNKIFIDIANKVFTLMDERDRMLIYSHWAHTEVKQDIDYVVVAQIVAVTILIFAIIVFYSIKSRSILAKIKEQQYVLNSSIDYALTVQLALMGNNHSFDNFFKNHFLLWKPKDKVGGDIYLSREISSDEILIYVIDCVGHGIPGALLTVYVKAIEEQVLPHFKLLDEPLNTSKILDFFHAKMLGLYSKNIAKNQVLCFDGAVFYYNKKTKTVKFSGANTPIFYIQDHKIETIKTNRRIVGISSKRDKDFIEHNMKINKDTFFYIGTDGMMDQIGGDDSLPLGKEKLKVQFLKDYKKSAVQQKENIMEMLTIHQKNNPRLDDITLVAFEIKSEIKTELPN